MFMLTEDYVDFETAKLLKEKGFDAFSYYGWDEQLFDKEHPRNFSIGIDDKKQWISCHTHQMAMKWLRDKKDISIVIIDDEIPLSYKYIIKKYSISDEYKVLTLKIDSLPFIKYEVACEAALKYTLENLI